LFHALPESIRDFVTLLGWDATAALVRVYGGLKIWIPRARSNRASAALLAHTIGDDAADKLIAHYGGAEMYIPFCKSALRRARNVSICREYTAGTPVCQLVAKYGVSYRQIDKILKNTDASVETSKNQLEWGF
jgi:hypothetical protein